MPRGVPHPIYNDEARARTVARMAASATVQPGPISVVPGEAQSVWVQVRNRGETVDDYVFQVLGEPAKWVEVDPESLPLFPGAEGELKLTFRPPRLATTAAGVIPFGIRISSKENPDDSIVEESSLDVAAFSDAAAELTPRTSHGRLAGKHELAFDNRGNTTVNTDIEGWDANDLLTFSFKPPSLVAEPGTATFTKVRAKPKKRFLRGSPKTLPFQLRVQPEEGEPRVVDGAVLQEALIPKWVLPAVLGLAALAALWALVLKPQIQSTAKDAVKDTNAAQQKQIDAATKQANTASQQATAASQQATAASQQAAAAQTQAAKATTQAQQASNMAGGASQQAGNATKQAGNATKQAGTATKQATEAGDAAANATSTANTAQATAQATAQSGTPTDGRLQADCGSNCQPALSVPADLQSISITDLILQNPAGDSGKLTLLRGSDVVLTEQLDNFRDLDFHFIAPLVLTSGQQLVMKVQCANGQGAQQASAAATAPSGACTPAVYYAGFSKKS
jgi:hypothetical protein